MALSALLINELKSSPLTSSVAPILTVIDSFNWWMQQTDERRKNKRITLSSELEQKLVDQQKELEVSNNTNDVLKEEIKNLEFSKRKLQSEVSAGWRVLLSMVVDG